MRIEGAPRYHIRTRLQTPPAFLVLTSHALCALGRFLIFSKVTTYPFATLLLRFRSSLVALQQFACRFFCAVFCFHFQTLMVYDWMWFYKFFMPPCGFKLKRLLQLKFIGWKRVRRINFQTSRVSRFLDKAVRNNFIFSESQVRIKCHMLVSRTH